MEEKKYEETAMIHRDSVLVGIEFWKDEFRNNLYHLDKFIAELHKAQNGEDIREIVFKARNHLDEMIRAYYYISGKEGILETYFKEIKP